MANTEDGANNDTFHPTTHQESVDKSKELEVQLEDVLSEDKKDLSQEAQNLVCADDEHEPKLHARTWIVLIALCTQKFIQSYSWPSCYCMYTKSKPERSVKSLC